MITHRTLPYLVLLAIVALFVTCGKAQAQATQLDAQDAVDTAKLNYDDQEDRITDDFLILADKQDRLDDLRDIMDLFISKKQADQLVGLITQKELDKWTKYYNEYVERFDEIQDWLDKAEAHLGDAIDEQAANQFWLGHAQNDLGLGIVHEGMGNLQTAEDYYGSAILSSGFCNDGVDITIAHCVDAMSDMFIAEPKLNDVDLDMKQEGYK